MTVDIIPAFNHAYPRQGEIMGHTPGETKQGGIVKPMPREARLSEAREGQEWLWMRKNDISWLRAAGQIFDGMLGKVEQGNWKKDGSKSSAPTKALLSPVQWRKPLPPSFIRQKLI